MKSRSDFRYRTDVAIPNLDAMSPSALRKFAEWTAHAASLQQGAKADWLRLAARYARYKVKAMEARLAGKIPEALRYERECDNTYGMIPQRMKW